MPATHWRELFVNKPENMENADVYSEPYLWGRPSHCCRQWRSHAQEVRPPCLGAPIVKANFKVCDKLTWHFYKMAKPPLTSTNLRQNEICSFDLHLNHLEGSQEYKSKESHVQKCADKCQNNYADGKIENTYSHVLVSIIRLHRILVSRVPMYPCPDKFQNNYTDGKIENTCSCVLVSIISHHRILVLRGRVSKQLYGW
jgi:hypothetical protein